jgi:hypothetical protein
MMDWLVSFYDWAFEDRPWLALVFGVLFQLAALYLLVWGFENI